MLSTLQSFLHSLKAKDIIAWDNTPKDNFPWELTKCKLCKHKQKFILRILKFVFDILCWSWDIFSFENTFKPVALKFVYSVTK